MANVVRIATLGPAALRLEKDEPNEARVERMLAHWRHWLGQVKADRPDLIVVPEACDRFAGMVGAERTDYYRARGMRLLELFARVAAENGCYVVYSAVVQVADGSWRNAAIVLDRSGREAGRYHKNHLVIEENTEYGLRYGKSPSVVTCDFGRVGLAICYDLNFEELRRQYAALRPDVMVFVSMYHGGLVQGQWAYACRSHFVGAVAGLPCEIRDPFGRVLYSSTNYRPYVVGEVNLDCCMAHLDHNEGRLAALKARYGPEVIVDDPGYVGAVLISSRVEGVTAREMAGEFGIELIDDYFARALAHRREAGRIEP